MTGFPCPPMFSKLNPSPCLGRLTSVASASGLEETLSKFDEITNTLPVYLHAGKIAQDNWMPKKPMKRTTKIVKSGTKFYRVKE